MVRSVQVSGSVSRDNLAVLVLACTPRHGKDAGHVSAGADQHVAFGIVIDTLAVAILGIAQRIADILGKRPQADRQIPVTASEATILRWITGVCQPW